MRAITEEQQWAVCAPGRGYIGWRGDLIIGPGVDTMDALRTEEQALKSLADARRKYIDMGCPEVADTLIIVSRTAEIRVNDWTSVKVHAES